MTKVAITGASGFVGENICRSLIRCGHDVLRITRSDYGDFCLVENWDEIFNGIDIVIHLAAIAHRTQGNVNDAEYEKVNYELVREVAQGALRAGVKIFIFLSSAKVYGEKSISPFSEADELNPQDAYSRSKALAEAHLLEINGFKGCYILRVPLIYGPGVKANFKMLYKLSRLSFPLPIGGYNTRRSYLSVRNLASAIEFLIERKVGTRDVYNVADIKSLSLREVISIIRKTNNQSAKIFWFPPLLIKLFFALVGMSRLHEKLFDSFEISTEKITELGWRAATPMEDNVVEV